MAGYTWFHFGDEVVAMGAGITTTDGNVAPGPNGYKINTTINQVLYNGWHNEGTVGNTKWYVHDAIAYIGPDNQTYDLSTSIQSGDWETYDNCEDDENDDDFDPDCIAEGQVYRLAIDHGYLETNDRTSYFYRVVPDMWTESQITGHIQNNLVEVIYNLDDTNNSIQAVRKVGTNNDGGLGVIYYPDGFDADHLDNRIEIRQGLSISTSHPCALLYDESTGEVCISSPDRINLPEDPSDLNEVVVLAIDLDVFVNGSFSETISFPLPDGEHSGTSICKTLFSLAGNIESHCIEEGVANVEIETASSGVQVPNTDLNGDYYISNLMPGADFTITPSKNTDLLEGVSSWDLILIQRHILQTLLLDTPYRMIAADINRSGSITTTDMTELRKAILLIEDNFPNNESWRFVQSSFVFPNPANPFATIFPESVSTQGLGSVPVDFDFKGIKIGDVNCSADNTTQFSPCDDDNELEILIEEKALRANDVYTVAVRTNNFKDISAYQFALGYDKTKLEYQSIQQGDLNRGAKADNFKVPTIGSGNPGGGNKEQINTLWLYNDASDLGFTVLDTTLTDTASLFLVTFKALVNIPAISQVINLQTQNFDAAAWSDGGDCARNVTMAFLPEGFAANRNAGQSVSENMTSSVRVHPNPTVGDLVFEIITALSSENSIQIYNTTGQQVLKQKVHLEKGSNTVAMDNISSWQDGLYFFTITDSSGAFISGKFVKK